MFTNESFVKSAGYHVATTEILDCVTTGNSTLSPETGDTLLTFVACVFQLHQPVFFQI